MTMSFTGYLLPFDQRSYWATIVANNITATGPVVGPYLADFLRAGPEIGATTLSRFYSIHMLLVPGLIFALIGAIVAEFVGAQKGLGMLIQAMNFNMDVSGQFSILLILSVVGLCLNAGIVAIRRRVLFWDPATKQEAMRTAADEPRAPPRIHDAAQQEVGI